MKAFHDSRDIRCREPYGVVAPGTAVVLALDVWDAPGATVLLRTWVDGKGESLYPMRSVLPNRFEMAFEPQRPGVIWYQFVIVNADGSQKRYGAQDGARGGIGQLYDWEPPSFQLTVVDPDGEETLEEMEERALGRAFEDVFIDYLCNEMTAPAFIEALEALRENCSEDGYRQVLDVLGRTDPSALIARLGGGNLGLAKGRLWCASLVQLLGFGLPVSSCGGLIERWAQIDEDCEAIMRNAVELRDALPPFGEAAPLIAAIGDDVLSITAHDAQDSACVLVNASLENAHDTAVPMMGETVSETIAGYGVAVVEADEIDEAADAVGEFSAGTKVDKFACTHLYQLGTAALLFGGATRLGRPMEPGLGVLAHITSLPNAKAGQPGSIGPDARSFVDWLADAGVGYWQILPVNPTDEHGSPYAGISAFAGSMRLLGRSADSVLDGGIDDADYQAFCAREADWLEPYACFMAIREKLGAGLAWQEWPEEYRRFDPAVIEGDSELREAAERQRRGQYLFEREWGELRAYANKRGVSIIGDMPIYVSADSADVWSHPEIFQLGQEGRPEVVAGCPPDSFAVEGQVWGNPVYDWDALRECGYAWWLRRLERAFSLYDFVRLDHFIGFERYFSIPAGQKAVMGSYRPGPGLGLFKAAYAKFGSLPIIAEDLGSITPSVRALVAACGFPGMDIVQFVDGGDPLAGYSPRPDKIVYTGTHDNQTLAGYCEVRYPDIDVQEAADDLMEQAVTCAAPVCVLPLQDVLGLGDEARMNEPGTVEGNWTWQADAADIQRASERLCSLVRKHSCAQ